jgi:hypothetical protein
MQLTRCVHHSISAVLPFPGLRCFPDGRDFQQWTGNDSKALMKVRVVLYGHASYGNKKAAGISSGYIWTRAG